MEALTVCLSTGGKSSERAGWEQALVFAYPVLLCPERMEEVRKEPVEIARDQYLCVVSQ